MVAGGTPGRSTVIAWSGGRRVHLLTRGAMSEGRGPAWSTPHPTADIDDIDIALGRIFRQRVQRRIRGLATLEVRFEVG